MARASLATIAMLPAVLAGFLSEHRTSDRVLSREIYMSTQRRELYTSSNGDSWYLCRDRAGRIVVSHEPNVSSGGKPSQVELTTFLARGNQGPEHQALLHLIGEMVQPSWTPEKSAAS